MARKPYILALSMLVVLLATVLAVEILPQALRTLTARSAGGERISLATAAHPQWAAAAPGRVEPRGGEIRITAAAPGRIAAVQVQAGARVAAGDILIRLEDDEAQARFAAAEAEESARKRERDAAPLTKGSEDRRRAEDAYSGAERALADARELRDRLTAMSRQGGSSPAELDRARASLQAAQQRLERERDALNAARIATRNTAASRAEAAVTQARSELTIAEAALEKTRIRAPVAGTVLQVLAKPGELVAPSADAPLVILGDLTTLRVRAEIDERDVGKVRVGQRAIVRNDAFRGRDFEGQVASLAPALGPPRIGPRGPRKPGDVDVLEVLIDLPGNQLLPGMRVDVFFAADPPTKVGLGEQAAQ